MQNTEDKNGSVKSGSYGYPVAEEGPETGYVSVPGNNPVLRGWLLSWLSTLLVNCSPLAGLFWWNVGFTILRKMRLLDNQESRFDPTVIPGDSSGSSRSSNVDIQSYLERSPGRDNRHLSAGDYQTAYRNGSSTPTAVASAILELISSNPRHRAAFLDIRASLVLAAAEASTARWKAGKPLSALDGVPVAVKDEVDIEGYRKTLATTFDLTANPNVTSWCVAQWEAAGAIIVGKTTMHELGLATTGNNADGNAPLNPHNPRYYCGGSSGGSAYVVAAGLVPIALGVDAGGSIRIPSAYCGLYGLKPSHGRVSRLPTPNVCASLSVVGPMAGSIADLELAYRIMATPNPADSQSSPFPPPRLPPALSSSRKKYLGIYTPYFDAADPSILTACHDALTHYTTELGYTTQEIHIPYLAEGQLAHGMTALSEICSASASLSTSTSTSSTSPSPSSTGAGSGFSSYHPSNRIALSVGAQTPATDFLLAQKLRGVLMRHLSALWRRYPGMLIVTPTTGCAGWGVGVGSSDSGSSGSSGERGVGIGVGIGVGVGEREREKELVGGVSDANMELKAMRFIWLANFVGCPALSVPVGRVRGFGDGNNEGEGGDGGEKTVPVGMMAMAEWGNEEGLMQWGRASEEWCWEEGGMEKPKGCVDVLDFATSSPDAARAAG